MILRVGVTLNGQASCSGRQPEVSNRSPFQSVSCQASLRTSRDTNPSSGSKLGATERDSQTTARAASISWSGDWETTVTFPEHSLEQQPEAGQGAGFFDTSPSPLNTKPLRINLDLLLYRARCARQLAFRASTFAEKQRQQKKAESLLRHALALDPREARAYVSLGKLLVQQKRYAEASQLYDIGSTATGGENEYIWQAWATLEAKQGHIAMARKLYDAAIVANSKHAAAWHGWGLLERRQSNYSKACSLWLKGIRACKQDPNPYLYQSLAVMLSDLDRVAEARSWFMDGTRTLQGIKSHALWQAWALMEQRKGDKTYVRYLYRKCLDANPRSRYTYLSWGRFEEGEGRFDDARALYRQGHQLNRRDPALLQAWGLLEARRGDAKKARELFEKGSLVDPSHLYIWQAWGVLEHRAGNADRARQLFQEGVWADPTSPNVATVFQAWAVLEAAEGNTALARQLFKCAVKANASSQKCWLSWAQFEEERGALQRADEIRTMQAQGRTEVVIPASFTAEAQEPLVEAMFSQIAAWWAKLESDTAQAMSRGRPRGSHQPYYNNSHHGDSMHDYAVDGHRTRPAPVILDMQEACKYNQLPLSLPPVKPRTAAAKLES